jgi:FHA domain
MEERNQSWAASHDLPDTLHVTIDDGKYTRVKDIRGGVALVGRLHGLRLCASAPDVSQCHAKVVWDAKSRKYKIYDDGSTCGSKLNGRTIPRGQPRNLKSGDVVKLGATAQLRIQVRVPRARQPSNSYIV